MARQNPETIITKELRSFLEDKEAYVLKICDQFTRGIPDMLVVTTRILMIEVKVYRRKKRNQTLTGKQLGLSGLQDVRIRQMARRTGRLGAFVFTNRVNGELPQLWWPSQDSLYEHPDKTDYMLAAEGWDNVWRVLNDG
jgi:hypothetical protein